MAEFKPVTVRQFEQTRRKPQTTFRAESARYDAQSAQLVVQLTNGASVGFPLRAIAGLEDAKPQDLTGIEVQGRGYGLHIPSLDADISVSRLFLDVLGSHTMSRAERRATASRANGAKGGRPKANLSSL